MIESKHDVGHSATSDQVFDMRQWILRWLNRRTATALPEVYFEAKANYYKAITSPSPDWNAVVHDKNSGARVGCLTYAISPLHDRIYVYDIKVEAEHQRCGYGSAILCHLARTHDLPIGPVHIVGIGNSFWRDAARLRGQGVTLLKELRAGDLEAEQTRWNHLSRERAELEAEIHRRFAAGERGYQATGRGLSA